MLRNVANVERLLYRNFVRYGTAGGSKVAAAAAAPGTIPAVRAPAGFGANKDLLAAEGSDPDSFGRLGGQRRLDARLERMADEDGDVTEINYLDGSEGKTRLGTKQYADMIKRLVEEKRIRDALDVLEVRMLKEDRARPENYIFNLLIGACARVGYTKKAFQLFNNMKSRGLKVTGGTYTSLFNACANSPSKSDGLKRATHLRQLIAEKAYTPNRTNYHAMIKAFGHCGDLATAFKLVDEMVADEIPVTSETVNFLLQACLSDREAGFRHALLVWRKLVERDIAPSVYTYNLLLRSVRDCGIGDIETLNEDLQRIAAKTDAESKQLWTATEKIAVVDGNNIIDARPKALTIANLRHVDKPKYRLTLIGGCRGFLERMSANKIKPDIRTATQLLEIIPSKIEAENDLLAQIEKYGIELDIGFCNMLIKKRNMRDCRDEAKEVLKLISGHRLKADIVTFGVLAIGCRGSAEIEQLLSDIEQSGFRPNVEIAGALLNASIRSWDVGTVLRIMDLTLELDIRPNRHFIKHLERFHDFVQQQIELEEDLGREDEAVVRSAPRRRRLLRRRRQLHSKLKDPYFREAFRKFCYRYTEWKGLITPDRSDSVHPWHQFRTATQSQ